MNLVDYLHRVRAERARKLFEQMKREAQEWLRRNPVLYVRVRVRNRVTGESWYADFDTEEDALKYIHELANPVRGVHYRVYHIAPNLYDVGPFEVSLIRVRGGMLRR